MQKFKRSRTILIITLLLVLILSPLNGLLYAQDGSPQMIITGVNVEQFPNISVTIYGEGLGVALADVEFELLEDNTLQHEIESATEAVGIQVALVLDASTNILLPGQTGIPRLEEVNNAIGQLTQGQILIEQDWIAGVAFNRRDDTAVPAVIAPWNLDHQAVINSFFSYQPDPANDITPLVDQIFFAMNQFNDARVPTNLMRHIVVFSDGVDVLSPRVVDDLPRRAEELGVRIHTVQIGPSDVSRNLQRIAEITGGTFHSINAQTPLVEALWQTLKAQQTQRKLTYRSTHAAPQEVAVRTVAGTGAVLQDTAAIRAIRVEAPQVQIVRPQSGRIEKNADAYDTPLAELTPTELQAEIAISWPDGRPRTIRSIEYTINGSSRRTTPGNVTEATLSIADLDNGRHTLRVRAIDELGLEGESEALSLEVVVNRPEPTPTPNFVATRDFERAEATATRAAEQTAVAGTATAEATNATATAVVRETATTIALETSVAGTATAFPTMVATFVPTPPPPIPPQEDPRNWIALVSSVLAVVALFVAIRNPRVRQRTTEIVTGRIDALTEFFAGGHRDASGSPKARLILQDGDPSLPASIDLFSSSTRLGRDRKLVSIVIEDRRISRLHCRIAEEASGAFKIWDEGSTSGTYVNHQKVEMSGHVLQPGDLIHIGPVSYRFEPLLSSMGAGADPTIGATAYDNTEPFLMAPGAQGQSSTAQMTEAATQYDMSGMDAPTQADLSNYSSEAFDSTQYMINEDFDDNAPYDSNGKRRK